MAENPYQPLPSGNAAPPLPSEPGVPSDIGGVFSRASELFWSDPIAGTVGVWASWLLKAAPALLILGAAWLGGATPASEGWTTAGWIAAVIGFFWAPVVSAGLARLVLTGARGEGYHLYHLLGESDKYLAFLAWHLVISAPALMLGIVRQVLISAGMLESGVVINTVQMGLSVIFWIVAALGPITSPFYIVDRNMGGLEAIHASWVETREMRGHALVVSLLAWLVLMGGAMLCGVGVCAAMPISTLMIGVLYRQVRVRQPSS